MKYSWRSLSVDDTIEFGLICSKSLKKNNIIILLRGDLGAGKTTFVRGIASGFGVDESISSPSFNLLNIYSSDHCRIYHIDAYRNQDVSWSSLMLDDFITEPFCCIIEWPENFKELPQVYQKILINIEIEQDSRLFTISTGCQNIASSIAQNFNSSRLHLVQY